MLNGSKQDCLSPSDVTIREYLPKYTDNSYSLIAIHTHTHVYRRPKKTFLQRRNTDVQQAHEKMFNITNYQRNAKTTVRYHLTPARIDIIRKSTNNKSWRGCGEKGTLPHCCECTFSCFRCIPLYATLWTVALQASLSIGFSRQVYWSGLSCPPPGI